MSKNCRYVSVWLRGTTALNRGVSFSKEYKAPSLSRRTALSISPEVEPNIASPDAIKRITDPSRAVKSSGNSISARPLLRKKTPTAGYDKPKRLQIPQPKTIHTFSIDCPCENQPPRIFLIISGCEFKSAQIC